MSRWKSPQTSTKRSARAAQESERSRREKRRGLLTVVVVVLASLGLLAADYFWQRHEALQRHERRHHPLQQGANIPARQTNQ